MPVMLEHLVFDRQPLYERVRFPIFLKGGREKLRELFLQKFISWIRRGRWCRRSDRCCDLGAWTVNVLVRTVRPWRRSDRCGDGGIAFGLRQELASAVGLILSIARNDFCQHLSSALSIGGLR